MPKYTESFVHNLRCCPWAPAWPGRGSGKAWLSRWSRHAGGPRSHPTALLGPGTPQTDIFHRSRTHPGSTQSVPHTQSHSHIHSITHGYTYCIIASQPLTDSHSQHYGKQHSHTQQTEAETLLTGLLNGSSWRAGINPDDWYQHDHKVSQTKSGKTFSLP